MRRRDFLGLLLSAPLAPALAEAIPVTAVSKVVGVTDHRIGYAIWLAKLKTAQMEACLAHLPPQNHQ